MNFSEAMQMLGTKLQGKYGHLGFKYKKSDKTLTRHSKNFTYMIAFSSFGGNTKDSISIEVCYIINTRPYDPYGYAKPDINTQPLFYSLRDNEIYLDIGNEEKIYNAFEVVCQWMDKILIPKMNELCATEQCGSDGGERAWTPMNKESLTEKLLDLVEGRETPETWRSWWDEHETELETLLSRGEFLKLKPCRHGFQWVPVFGSQKGAIAILEKSGTAFEASNLYQEQYLAELDAFCKEQERVQREKQKEFKTNNPELFGRYPKFSKALAKGLDPSDEIQPAATEEQIASQESVLNFTLPAQVREFFLLTAGINVSTGVIVELSGTFHLTIHGERYCVLGEFWKEADGDQLLLRPGEETIWYYAHEQDKVKRLCNDMTELLEKKLARYLNEQ